MEVTKNTIFQHNFSMISLKLYLLSPKKNTGTLGLDTTSNLVLSMVLEIIKKIKYSVSVHICDVMYVVSDIWSVVNGAIQKPKRPKG